MILRNILAHQHSHWALLARIGRIGRISRTSLRQPPDIPQTPPDTLQTPTRHPTDTFLKPPDTFQTRTKQPTENPQDTSKNHIWSFLIINFDPVFGQNLISVQKREVTKITKWEEVGDVAIKIYIFVKVDIL